MHEPHITHTPPLGRREFLRVGALAFGGLTLADVLKARAASGNARHDTSVILLYLHGGPSQLETYDLKPEAPSDYRSIFRAIPTNVSGIDICEHFPRQAKIADKFAIVRSLHHDVSIHSDGAITVLTGKRPVVLDPTSSSKSTHPDFGSITSHARGVAETGLPQYVAIPSQSYTRPTYLGVQHAPLTVGNPAARSYRPPQLALAPGTGPRFAGRRSLLRDLDRLRSELDLTGQGSATEEFRSLAFEILTSAKTANAFDLNREDERLRERYGPDRWGQACLLARRLAEAGTAVISLFMNTPESGKEFTNWDDHILNAGRPGHFGKYMERRLPYLDRALATLIEDIYTSGLDRRIMVVVVGEFGRTPKLRVNANGVGRDHWPQAYSALLAGGGLKTGQIVGATNSKAEYPTAQPYSPQDLLATIYRHLGIDPGQSLLDFRGRPVPILASGAPIRELI